MVTMVFNTANFQTTSTDQFQVVDSFFYQYISPAAISYSVPQIKWLLFWRDVLRVGDWPMPDPAESVNSTSSSNHAHFETACIIIAEVESRLKLCGRNGEITEEFYTDHFHSEYLEKNKYFNIKYHLKSDFHNRELDQILKRTLFYISFKRKKYPYNRFIEVVKSGIRFQDADRMLRGGE